MGLLLTASLFAGCTSEAPVAVEAADRLSVAAEDDAARGPTTTVPLGSTDLVGLPGVEHKVGVEIPEEALAVRAALRIDSGAVQGLRLDLPGCRLLHVPSANTPAATVTLVGECEPQGRGLQQATLAFDAGGFVGTLRFEAVVPA